MTKTNSLLAPTNFHTPFLENPNTTDLNFRPTDSVQGHADPNRLAQIDENLKINPLTPSCRRPGHFLQRCVSPAIDQSRRTEGNGCHTTAGIQIDRLALAVSPSGITTRHPDPRRQLQDRFQLSHHDAPRQCRACNKEWDEYQNEVVSVCQIFRGEHDQLYDEALHIFFQINTFSIECGSGSVLLKKLVSGFVLDNSEAPAAEMTWIQRLEIERLDSSAWPFYHQFLVSCSQLSYLTIVLKSYFPEISAKRV